MGADASKFDTKGMPDYFIENPEVTFESTMFLERSLRSVVKGEPSEDAILPFTEFYTIFFDRFFTIFESLSSGCHGFEESNLEDKSMFLIVILKFIVKSPMYMLLARKNGKWQTTERRRLKKFVALYKDLSCEAYDAIGQAIFHAISECDVLYSKWVRTAWIEAYSIFLSQIATIVFKDKPKFMKKRRSIYESNDESLDWSDDHFSDFSPDSSAPPSPAGSDDEFFSSSSCSSSGRSSPSLSPSPASRKPKNANTRNRLAVRLAKLKVKRKIKRQPPKALVQMALESTATETAHARNKSKSRSSRRNSWSSEKRPQPPNSALPQPMTFSKTQFHHENTSGIVEQILVASAIDSSSKSRTRSSRAISSADRLQSDRRQAKRRIKKGFRLEKTRTSYGGRQDFEEEEEDNFHLFVSKQAPRRYSSSLSRSRGISF